MSGIDHDTSSQPAGTAASSLVDDAAGKSTRTQAFAFAPGEEARFGIGNFRCEGVGPQAATGCIWPPESGKRDLFKGTIARFADIASQNFQTALDMETVEQLLKKASTWSPVADLFFNALSWVLGRAVSKGIKALLAPELNDISVLSAENEIALQRQSKMAQTAVTTLFGVASKGVHGALKAAANGMDPDAQALAQYLTVLADALPTWAVAVTTAAVDLDDVGLVMLARALDPEHHSRAYYRQLVVDLVAQFQSQILDVGKQTFEGGRMRQKVVERRIIWITDGTVGRKRLASADAIHGAHWRFGGWIDDSLIDVARQAAEAPPTGEVPEGETSWTGIPEVSGFDETLENRDDPTLQAWLVPAAAAGAATSTPVASWGTDDGPLATNLGG